MPYLEFYRVIGEWSTWHYGHIVFDPLAEVFDHVLVLHPFDINVLFKRRRIIRNKGFLNLLTWTRWSRLTYIRTNSFNSIGYFGEGIVQCWDVGDDWFFIRRLDVNIWWETYKPRGHEWQQTRASCTLRVIFHDLNDSVCDSYPQDPVVWPPPAVQLHKMRLLNLIGWSVLTHGSCPQGPVCNRKRQR